VSRIAALPFRQMRRTLLLVLGIGMALALAPAGNAAAPDAGLPDRWSGAWPAQLMPDAVALGTLTWRSISYEEGNAYLGKAFGGLPFEGCPADGRTRFFRGKYHVGGDLIGCTVGDDARTLVGRFNGNEQLRSGSFTITLVHEGAKPLFFGQYFEDHGVTTDWCGTLEPGSRPPAVTDTAAPLVDVLTVRRTGRTATVRFRAYDETATVRVEVQVRRAGRVVARTTVTARGDGTIRTAKLRLPVGVRGALTVSVRARDTGGNATGWTTHRLRA
jgi:hypothetical protein